MTSITPDIFGSIHAKVAQAIENGIAGDRAVQLVVREFETCDPVDVADVAEGALEGWMRLQADDENPFGR